MSEEAKNAEESVTPDRAEKIGTPPKPEVAEDSKKDPDAFYTLDDVDIAKP